MKELNLQKLKLAAKDFRYLLNKDYPREKSLSLIGDRYSLDSQHRQLLHRAIFSEEEVSKRKSKLVSIEKLNKIILGVDGHNIIITLESALKGILLVKAADGVVRDIAGVSSNYKITEITFKAVAFLTEFFKNSSLERVDFYFDSPISYSGELAKIVKQKFLQFNLSCKSSAVKVPEKELTNYEIIASSDSVLINISKRVLDIAGIIIKKHKFPTISLT